MIDFREPVPPDEVLWRMVRTLRHRGPDDEGLWRDPGVALGHTRLSIIDLSQAGHQPMVAANSPVALVYNGELYNFPELRRELEAAGASFRGDSDSEVVLEAYLHWGLAALRRFNGMFALALWDGRDRRLHLARDRFGIKPLFWARRAGGIAFGSEIKAILAAGGVARELDPQGLHEFLYYGVALGERTLFDGIHELQPGSVRSFGADGDREDRFFCFEEIVELDVEAEEAVEGVAERLEAAVRRHLISDVPVGVFLSGGVDSSGVTAFASRHAVERIRTYSVGFDFDDGVGELPKARRVAEHFDTEHVELFVRGGEISQVIERLIRHHDQPFGDAANIPLFLLCQELAGSAKVILQGDGGDEIFAGYRRYSVLAWERAWRRLAAVGRIAAGWPVPFRAFHRGMRFLQAMGQRDPALRAAWLLTQEAPDNPPLQMLGPAFRKTLGPTDPFQHYREVSQRFAERDAVQRMLYTDSSILLPDIFLEKVDRSTMAHGIEVRVPYLDAALTEYAMALPSRLKLRGSRKKWLLREALRGLVPDDILDGPKTGFGVPVGNWLAGPLQGYLRETLRDPSVRDAGLLDTEAVDRCIAEHVDRRRNHDFLLYKLLQLALWWRLYLVEDPLAHA